MPDLAFAAHVVEVDGALGELGHVVLVLVDVGLEVQPLAVEGLGAADADRTDDVRAAARRRAGSRACRGRSAYGIGSNVSLMFGCDRVERVGDGLLHLDLGRILTGAETAIPADRDRSGRGRSARGHDEGRGGGQDAETAETSGHVAPPPGWRWMDGGGRRGRSRMAIAPPPRRAPAGAARRRPWSRLRSLLG